MLVGDKKVDISVLAAKVDVCSVCEAPFACVPIFWRDSRPGYLSAAPSAVYGKMSCLLFIKIGAFCAQHGLGQKKS